MLAENNKHMQLICSSPEFIGIFSCFSGRIGRKSRGQKFTRREGEVPRYWQKCPQKIVTQDIHLSEMGDSPDGRPNSEAMAESQFL